MSLALHWVTFGEPEFNLSIAQVPYEIPTYKERILLTEQELKEVIKKHGRAAEAADTIADYGGRTLILTKQKNLLYAAYEYDLPQKTVMLPVMSNLEYLASFDISRLTTGLSPGQVVAIARVQILETAGGDLLDEESPVLPSLMLISQPIEQG